MQNLPSLYVRRVAATTAPNRHLRKMLALAFSALGAVELCPHATDVCSGATGDCTTITDAEFNVCTNKYMMATCDGDGVNIKYYHYADCSSSVPEERKGNPRHQPHYLGLPVWLCGLLHGHEIRQVHPRPVFRHVCDDQGLLPSVAVAQDVHVSQCRLLWRSMR